jgi:hypothetical protein
MFTTGLDQLISLLGNILSQQYGVSSECIGVTLDPAVAAFFATKA